MAKSDFKKQVDRILKDGVEQPGTRYECQMKLVWHYWSLNYTEEDCYQAVTQWYRSHDHQSKDWKKKPHSVLLELRRAVKSLYRNASLKGYEPRRRHLCGLTITDIERIIELTDDYRMQKFIFDLLRYALNAKDSDDTFRLPKNAIIKFSCCSSLNYQEKIRFCELRNLIIITREYYRQESRARTYRVHFSFSAEGEVVDSLEEGLKRIYTQRVLRARYSRWVYSKYLKE